MTTGKMRSAGEPSPLLDDTHDDAALPAAIPFDAAQAGQPELASRGGLTQAELAKWRLAWLGMPAAAVDPFDLGKGAPAWLAHWARLIRPVCVGALLAIPTLGAASVGLVAAIDPARGRAMAETSVLFLQGLPTDIVLLIGALATGYGIARTVEKLKGMGDA